MPNIQRPDGAIEAIVVARDIDDMLDVYSAAGKVGVTAMTLPHQSEAEKRGSALAVMSFYEDANAQAEDPHMDPVEAAALASFRLAAGGYVIKLRAQETLERSSQESMELFRIALGGIRRADREGLVPSAV